MKYLEEKKKNLIGKNLRFSLNKTITIVSLGLCIENEVMLKTTLAKLQSQINILHGRVSPSNSGRTFLKGPGPTLHLN